MNGKPSRPHSAPLGPKWQGQLWGVRLGPRGWGWGCFRPCSSGSCVSLIPQERRSNFVDRAGVWAPQIPTQARLGKAADRALDPGIHIPGSGCACQEEEGLQSIKSRSPQIGRHLVITIKGLRARGYSVSCPNSHRAQPAPCLYLCRRFRYNSNQQKLPKNLVSARYH